MFKLHRSLLSGLSDDAPSREDLYAALQSAIELEHATIPLYLYAMYSLDPNRNGDIRSLLRSVVVEEMLHMILGANVLNAIGGSPALAGRDFIPRYPGQLPGGVEGQLQLHLRPFSLAQLETFIAIEEPRDPIGHLSPVSVDNTNSCTIGEFYSAIETAMSRVSTELFVPGARHQIGGDLMFGSIAVTDLDSAIEAINTIIEQGEGTSSSPEEIDGPGGVNDLAHHYRLSEILKGRRLVRVNDGTGESDTVRYEYLGEPLTFDHGGVYELPEDPTAEQYPEGSEARFLVDSFNFTYTSLLNTLHNVINGIEEVTSFTIALSQMSSLDRLARAMAGGVGPSRQCVGPTFQYQPISPVANIARSMEELALDD